MGKIALIAAFAIAALARGEPRFLISEDVSTCAVFQSPFAVQLVYVSFAYSGWNAAAYLLGEFRQPQGDVPRVVLFGTLIVMGLYLAPQCGVSDLRPGGRNRRSERHRANRR